MADKTAHTTGAIPRRKVLRNGLLLGAGVTVGTLASGAITNAAKASTSGPQPGWAFCYRCAGLFYQPKQARSVCPASAVGHQISTSYNYWLYYNDTVKEGNPQSAWLWCGNCQGLFYAPGDGALSCPAGGSHVAGPGSFNYSLPHDVTGGQGGWYFCFLCNGLFHGGAYTVAGVCPAPSSTGNHYGVGSYNYHLAFNGYLP